MILEEHAVKGLHDFLVTEITPKYTSGKGRALDLGAGSGSLADRLCKFGFDVLAVDIDAEGFKAPIPFRRLDLNDPGFAEELLESGSLFDLVTAVEVIEHLESPIGFLRNVRRLLNHGGTAVVTTPNMDNLPARVKFLLRGRLRTMDEKSHKVQVHPHISPIFWDLLIRQWLPRAGLKLAGQGVFPPDGYALTRWPYALAFSIAARVFGGRCLLGDSHILILRRAE